MKKLLICVDYQYDFVADDGLLTCGKPAQDVYQNILKKVKAYISDGQDIIFTHDAHRTESWAAHPESRAFPPHCVAGTSGYELYGELADIEKNEKNVKKVDKKAYCMDFAEIDAIIAKNYDIIEICGVTTDICVLQSAVGLYTAVVNAGSAAKLAFAADCCASFNPAGHDWALEYMEKTLGFEKI